MTAASLEKLPCHVDFPHISSIALFDFKFGLAVLEIGYMQILVNMAVLFFSKIRDWPVYFLVTLYTELLNNNFLVFSRHPHFLVLKFVFEFLSFGMKL